jgi:putative ABC transport system permease protein
VNVLTRGIRNAFRNNIRTFSIVLILGLSIGLTLAMLVARQAVTDKIDSVKSSIGNTITVSPAGARGFEGGGEPLTAAQMTQVESIDHVTAVTQTLSDRLTSDTSNLTSAIEAGTLGERRANDSGVSFQGPPESSGFAVSDGSNSQVTRTFTPPVTVTGASDISQASVFGGDSVSYTSGQAFDASSEDNIAVVGTALAEKNGLSVGSTFTAYSTSIEVVGIYDTGNAFSNAGLVMPIKTLQKLSDQVGQVTSATITVDSIDNVDQAVASIKAVLGTTADVVSQQDTSSEAIQPLESIQQVTLISLIGAMIAGAVIILLTMIMIVRERRREVGVLKAIGASNFKITTQFIFEAITLTIIGSIVGIGVGIAAAKPLTNTLVTNSTNSSSSQVASTPTIRGRNAGPGPGMLSNVSRNGISIGSINTTISWTILLYGFGSAFVIAIAGSAIPSFLIAKVRPAEVMRAE